VTDKRVESNRQAALMYHEFPKPGKLEIKPTKPLANGRDLSLAYSPGVAEACLEIKDDPANAENIRSVETWSVSSPTAPRCWVWAISAALHPSR